MSNKQHHYQTQLNWVGNDKNKGTKNARSYSRDHEFTPPGKQHTILGSSDPAFLGDATRYCPEDLLLQSLAACHMLWYLNICSANKIVVTAYEDQPEGVMEESPDGGGAFVSIKLRPKVTVAEESMVTKAGELHAEAHKFCFIARSVNFPVEIAGSVMAAAI
ncbi:OsmC family protein [Neolewinella antarctica]|uniref:Organic hydroperoxide reductase OsmC/OhrA n=1 Tax=Neolewinella antarctica TaxID=442734 RepID=A0ABX0XCX2_9BACT|nr:OsmC family protein [Neolewinella antarctica]NJC26781.1 organic hydroperoxide reductase OsmC/OhrA [Neolewinella antarctica]